MTIEVQQVLEKATGLSPMARAELVEGILASFDFPGRAEIDAAWAREAELRIEAFNRGEIPTIPADQVFEKIERKYAT